MSRTDILIRGAREHNLRSVDLQIPHNKLVVMTGVSGSGKSSLAFDTLYAEGQRRYVESLSSYARQFLGQLPKPEVDAISGLAPSISIQQKMRGRNPRSTVGTITEIYDYLRVLYARIGHGHCPQCGRAITAQSSDQIIDHLACLPDGTRFQILAPVVQQQKGEYKDLFTDLLKQGFLRARVDGRVVQLTDDLQLDRQMRHSIEVVVDRLQSGKQGRNRLAEAVETALRMGHGTLIVSQVAVDSRHRAETSHEPEVVDQLFSARYACTHCQLGFETPSPQLFSFNSPQGMCPECNGLGMRHDFLVERLVPDDRLSLQKGAIELLGPIRKIGRWRRHLLEGAMAAIEAELDMQPGSLAKTAWRDLPAAAQQLFLHGLGTRNVTYTWRSSGSVWKHGGTFDGYVAELQEGYRKTSNPMRRRQLEKYMEFRACSSCGGSRVNSQARSVRIVSNSSSIPTAGTEGLSLPQVCALSIERAAEFFADLKLDDTESLIAEEVLKEIRGRLGFLEQCGLGYLTLERTAPTLSGGESQRIRLASQIGCGLVGVVYILDEPSIGLHPRDNELLLESLLRLRDQGNTVIVVEHDEETIRAADYLVDFGPGPGVRGGEIVARGKLADLTREPRSLTGQYLSGALEIKVPESRRQLTDQRLTIRGAGHNNLRGIDVSIPLGTLTCVTGVSGSGKSSLVNDILWQRVNRDVNGGNGQPGLHTELEGLELLDKAIAIDQTPIGRTPRSNPATYVKVFDLIRNLFTQLPDSRVRGYKAGRFSFNVSGGRCESCEGYGSHKLEMDFLADIWVTCPICTGRRFNRETLEIQFKGANIAEILEMDIGQACEHFENHPKIARLLQTLCDVGLDYLKLGQPSPTLSGGEAQRIKLARELGKRSTGQTLYLLDEPTTGLHFADIHKLLEVLHRLVDAGNTVLIVEHNTDVIKSADWVIDLGPEGGEGGGRVILEGTPEDVAACPASHTGRALAPVLGIKRREKLHQKAKASAPRLLNGPNGDGKAARNSIVVRGAMQHNLQNVDVRIPRDKLNVFCGPSGSGKSSLAMDTLYAEGQRRYVESLSAYARQFLGQMPKPRVEHVHGLSPSIAIEQKTVGNTPRSTVGTVTEIYDYLRVLFARLGHLHCPECGIPVDSQTTDEVVDRICEFPAGSRLLITAPQEVHVGQSYERLWERLKTQGFTRVRIDGSIHRLEDVPEIDRRRRHEVDIICDRLTLTDPSRIRSRIADSVESAFELGEGMLHVVLCDSERDEQDWSTVPFSLHHACQHCGRSFEELSPHNFSFNSPLGWCPACEGLGFEYGTDLSQLVSNPNLTLTEGAVVAWPDASRNPLFDAMLAAMCRQMAIPLDVPYRKLEPGHQRMILHGTGDRWFELDKPRMQFQYKGLYPAISEATRVSYPYRQRLHGQVGELPCSVCNGSRLRDDAAAVRFQGHTLQQLVEMPMEESLEFLKKIKLRKVERQVAGDLLEEATGRLSFLVEVGLDYLTLARTLPTLSGGETQRIRLAGQLGRALTGVLYVLDEPTIGLHPRDNGRLLNALKRLRDLGNTLILVEHDREVLDAADRLYDFGPRAGRLGGQVVAEGSPAQLKRRKGSLTGSYLGDRLSIPIPTTRRFESSEGEPPGSGWLELTGARQNNLRQVDLRIPLGTMTCVTGVSGSGKSSLVETTLARAVAQRLHRAQEQPGPFAELRGLERVNKLIVVDQQPLGSMPASNPATYTGVFDHIRELFSQLPDSRVRGFRPGRFSFNRPGGRCDACEGNGQKCIEMHFLPDVWVECDVCRGTRFNHETLQVKFHGHSIADVLDMPIGKALELFDNIPKIRGFLATLCAVGLDYLTLGQSAPTLSGGEAQRVKLAAELARPQTGQTLYVLDEPTTGLHFDDIDKLLKVLNSLVDLGNTVLVIEHNLDVIKSADWIIDLGPEAGSEGGRIVAAGTPEQIVSRHAGRDGADRSWTADVLKPVLEAGERGDRSTFDAAAVMKKRQGDLDVKQIGKQTRMPWEVDGRQWHVHDRVSHNGQPCRWEGRALDFIVDQLAAVDGLEEPDWSDRSVVEITSRPRKAGWFMHALTGEEWLLKLKFRVKRNAFKLEQLRQQIPLQPLDDLDELPIYGRSERLQVRNLKGPWQEVSLSVHWLHEIETPPFREFLQEAAASFLSMVTRDKLKPSELTPWKVLGRKWHLSRKGFASNRRVHWPAEMLEQILDLVEQNLPGSTVDWGNKQIVKWTSSDGQKLQAAVNTKRREGIDLTFFVEPGRIPLGRIADLGADREIKPARGGGESVRIRFDDPDQIIPGRLKKLLAEV